MAFFNSQRFLIILFCCAVVAFTFGLPATNKWPGLLWQSSSPDKLVEATGDTKTLTFAQRVAYQRAIEEVYWRHRIWPKERPDPKPSLDAVMSQAQIGKES